VTLGAEFAHNFSPAVLAMAKHSDGHTFDVSMCGALCRIGGCRVGGLFVVLPHCHLIAGVTPYPLLMKRQRLLMKRQRLLMKS
jgi:hypothetical protein